MLTAETSCSIEKLEGPAKIFGNSVGEHTDVSFEECGEKCLKVGNCYSFAYHELNKKCFLKDEMHNASSPIRNKNKNWFSAFLSGNCPKGIS